MMNHRPVHELDVIHRWQEIDRIDSGNGNFKIVRKCLDCEIEAQGFKLGSRGRGSDDMPNDKQVAMMRETSRKIASAFTTFQEMFEEHLIAVTKFSNFDDLVNEIHKRYEGEIDAQKLPYSQLENWIDGRTKKGKAKRMLQYMQGSVCNRCKSIQFSLSELTLDHIDGNRDHGGLANLQLLCRECHDDKHRSGPTRHDVSPFRFSSETTVIRIACTELVE